MRAGRGKRTLFNTLLNMFVTMLLGLALAGTAQASSAYTIQDDATGGDCTAIGTWDVGSKTCTLTMDLNVPSGDGIDIASDGVTLDGAGHTVTGGGGGGRGVTLLGRSGVTVRHLAATSFLDGFRLELGSGNTLEGNNADGNDNGFYLYSSSGNTLSGNSAGLTVNMGARLYYLCDNNVLAGNTFNSNGGYGIYIYYSSGNSLSGNTTSMNSVDGIFLSASSGNTVGGNTAQSNGQSGIHLDGSDGNTVSGNSAGSNAAGYYLNGSSNNTLSDNAASMNSSDGLLVRTGSNNNQVYWNSFISNAVQAEVSGSSGNVFNLPFPDGGNYWDDWTAPDSNNDGFVDNPYVFAGGQDNLPWTFQNGWWCGIKPALTLQETQVFWASFADYTIGLLSVSYVVDNAAGPDAYGVSITGTVNTGGVNLVSAVPLSLGNIATGGSASMTLQYDVPVSVTGFLNTVQASAWDICGNGYTYP